MDYKMPFIQFPSSFCCCWKFSLFLHIFIQWKHNHILTYSYTYVVCMNFRCFHYKYIPNYTILIRSVIKLNWIFHMRAEKLSIFHKKASVHTHKYKLWLIHNQRVTWITHLMELIRVDHENVKIFLNLISSNYVAIKFSALQLPPSNSWIAHTTTTTSVSGVMCLRFVWSNQTCVRTTLKS